MRSFNPDHVTTVEETDWLGSVKCSDTSLSRQNTCLVSTQGAEKKQARRNSEMNNEHKSPIKSLTTEKHGVVAAVRRALPVCVCHYVAAHLHSTRPPHPTQSNLILDSI